MIYDSFHADETTLYQYGTNEKSAGMLYATC